MNTKTLLRKLGLTLSLAALVFCPSTQAAPGPLPNIPLFLSNSVEPNVFFLLDDSGSMGLEIVLDSSASSEFSLLSGLPIVKNNSGASQAFSRFFQFSSPLSSVVPPAGWTDPDPTETWDDNLWLLRNHNFNKLYYDPMRTYVPWPGTDNSGNPLYSPADPTAVFQYPMIPTSNTVDLTQPHDWRNHFTNTTTSNINYLPAYYTWDSDTNGNGRPDGNEPHTLYLIQPSQSSYPSGRTYTEELQNFANWFQYYRSRTFAAKSAIGNIINNTDAARMGLRVINDAVHAGSPDRWQIQDVLTMSVPSNKSQLLNAYYNTRAAGFTPLRFGLSETGKYFMETGPDAPILPADQGGKCQQNFVIAMSDGFWNGTGSFYTPSYIGNADGDNNSVWDGDQTQSIDGGNYADSYSVTLADISMYYYENDLRSDLPDEVPTKPGIDVNNQQHLVTYFIGFGVSGSLDINNFDPLAPGFNWPDAMTKADARIDDMIHAAYNGRGQYLDAGNPFQLEASLQAILNDIAARTATASAVAINSAHLTSKSTVYVAQFNSNRWQGRLYAYPIIDLNLGTLASTPKWEANDVLTNRDIGTEPRQILTWNGSQGTPFEWNASSLSPAMMADLSTNPDGSTASAAMAKARLDYLRGDRSNENSGYEFRARPSLLGDLVNSGPVFVGAPSLAWPDTAPFPDSAGARYSDFKNGSAKTRKKVVYVGSNDGMLHAFDDDTGKELFAYAPNLLASTDINKGYHYLTDTNYIHNWYVDLTPTLSDAFLTTGAGSGWRTVLIGGLRGGGRGLFALDVTDPNDFSEANADKLVMWEFSNADDSDLGYTYSRPTIALANNGRWVAIFGNGYNDTGDGEAKLFILDIEAGLDGWQAGDYIEITTKAGSTSDRNGLATPALADVDGNGTVDRVYAGDLEGNMWAFDLSSSSSASWGIAYSDSGNPAPLFTTQANQPITAKPVLAKHPTIPDQSTPSNAPNLMVFFGTGQYLVESDKSSSATQSFYGVWDRGDKELDVSNLVEQTFDSSYTHRVLTRNLVDYSSKYGWRFDLPVTGERSVTSPVARADAVFFNTFIPETDPCSAGGYGYKFAVDMVTGGSPEEAIIDINKDGVIDNNDNEAGVNGVVAATRQDGFLPEPVFIEDLAFTGEVATKIRKLPDLPTGRFSWLELIQ